MGFDFERMLAAAMFAGTRIAGLMVFAPFFSSEAIPVRAKAGLTFVLTALLYPVYGPSHPALSPVGWIGTMGGEAVVGLILGLTLQIIFDAAQLAGQILGVQMGFSLVNVLDPQTQVDTPVLAIFHQLITLLIFLQLNVHHWLLRGIARSFAYLPPGGAIATFAASAQFLRAAGGIWLVGVQIAAPALLATMLTDVALGFLGKASPQLPIMLFGLSIKSTLGFVVLVGAMAWWPRNLERHFADGIALGEHLLHLAR